MKRPTLIIACVLSACLSRSTCAQPDRQPVLIDTDVGAGIDDAFALLLAFGSHELDVRGVTTVGDNTHNRAMMMCRFLTMSGRRHTRVAEGTAPQPDRRITSQSKYFYHPDPLFNRTTKPEKDAAEKFLFSRVKQQPGKVTVIALGPLTNVARLLAQQDATKLVKRVVILEDNIRFDVAAAQKVLAYDVPVVIVTTEAVRELTLGDDNVRRVFSPGTALTRQVQAMYQMWDGSKPPLGEALAVSLGLNDQSGFAAVESRNVTITDDGSMIPADGDAGTIKVVTEVNGPGFADWYVERLSSLVSPARQPVRLIEDDRMPRRVQVAENFDTDIERFWWMSGKPETSLLPPGSSRACRGVLTHDFDDLLMKSRQMYSAVIFNPVPGPPMGRNARLKFRYWLKGTDTIRVQIYSLTNGYHRQLVVTDLPQGRWQDATVDMTQARRPDGTGGPLGENERIDDIQFYIDPDAEIVVDDVVLYDAGADSERRPFPKRIMFTGIFDTGRQGQHWPGDFEIVSDGGNFWKAAKSVAGEKPGQSWIRLGLRGPRQLGQRTDVSFRYRLTNAKTLDVRMRDSASGKSVTSTLAKVKTGDWRSATLHFGTSELRSADEIHFVLPDDSELLLDDVLVFEPADE